MRKFGEKAADTHIAYCIKKSKRLPNINTSPVKKGADAFKNDGPPSPKGSKTQRLSRSYYNTLQKKNGQFNYKNIPSKVNSNIEYNSGRNSPMLSGKYDSNQEFKNIEKMAQE